MLIYITTPLQQTHKKIIRPPSPRVTSSPLAASSPHVAPALFVRSSVRLFIWLVVASSLCPLSLHPFPLHRHATSFAASRLSSSLSSSFESLSRRVVASLRHRVSSRLVVVSCHLTHLVMPALFDCCVVALHLVVTASFCLVVLLVASSCHRVASRSSPVTSRSIVISLSHFV